MKIYLATILWHLFVFLEWVVMWHTHHDYYRLENVMSCHSIKYMSFDMRTDA